MAARDWTDGIDHHKNGKTECERNTKDAKGLSCNDRCSAAKEDKDERPDEFCKIFLSVTHSMDLQKTIARQPLTGISAVACDRCIGHSWAPGPR